MLLRRYYEAEAKKELKQEATPKAANLEKETAKKPKKSKKQVEGN